MSWRRLGFSALVLALVAVAAPAQAAVLLQSDLPFGAKPFDYFFIEAEDADDLGPAWRLSSDPTLADYSVHAVNEPDPITGASGGLAIFDANQSTTSAVNGPGEDATWRLQFDTPGDYYLYVHTHSPLSDQQRNGEPAGGDRNKNDSFFTPRSFGIGTAADQVKANGDDYELLQSGGTGDTTVRGPWLWFAARSSITQEPTSELDQQVPSTFQMFTVTPGDVGVPLDLQIDHREDGTLIDALLFVSAAAGPMPHEVDAEFGLVTSQKGPITGVTISNPPGPPYELESVTIGNYTVTRDDLFTGTSTGGSLEPAQPITNADNFDLNSIAPRNTPGDVWEVRDFAGQTTWTDTNGDNVDFFIFEAGANDALPIQAILPGGTLGQVVNFDTSFWGATGLDRVGNPNGGQPIAGMAFAITDLLDAAGSPLTNSSVIEGLRIDSGTVDPSLIAAVILGIEPPPPPPPGPTLFTTADGFTVRTVYANVPPHPSLDNSLANAEALLALTSPDPAIANDITGTGVEFIDYHQASDNGNFDNDVPFPGGGGEEFAVQANAVLDVPADQAGDWTFLVTSNDGFRLSIDGAEIMSVPGNRAAADSFATADLSAGLHDLELVYFQGLMSATLELAAAQGGFTAFDPDDFHLIALGEGGTAIPEPSTLVLCALGLIGLLAFARRRRHC